MDSRDFFQLERAMRSFHEAETCLDKIGYKFGEEENDFYRHQKNEKYSEIYDLIEKNYKGKEQGTGPTKICNKVHKLFEELFEYERVNKIDRPFKGLPGYLTRIEHRKTQIKELQEKVAKLIEEAE